MSSHVIAGPIAGKPYEMPSNVKMVSIGMLVVGLALLGYGTTTEAWRVWSAGLIASYYFVSIAIGAGVVLALINVTKAGWGVVVRRIPEAITGYLPFGLLTMLAVTYFGLSDLYEWSHADIVAKDELLQHKAALLNVGGFFMRMVFIIGGWAFFTMMLRKKSRQQDADGKVEHSASGLVWGVLFLIFFGLSITFGALDWLMSLEPHWFSTMFGVYQFAGAHVAGCAMIALLAVHLKKGGFLPNVNENHLHDLGKMMFAFSTFWGYIWVCQYLLIWYANIPEETGYYVIRNNNGWFALFALNVVLNFIVPFFGMMPRPNKRNPKWLLAIGSAVLTGHFLDVYLQVSPATAFFHAHLAGEHGAPAGPQFGLTEIGGFLAVAGLFMFVVHTMLTKAPLLPVNDPYLQESLNHNQ